MLSDPLRKESQGRIKVTVVRPTGVLGTGLAGGVVNPDAVIGAVVHQLDRFRDRVGRADDRRPDRRGTRCRRPPLLGDHPG